MGERKQDGITLSEVEVVADDVMHEMKEAGALSSLAKTVQAEASAATAVAPSTLASYSLELPIGTEKIIVARAKVRDPVSNEIASYYGNAVVNPSDTSESEVTIKLIALPTGQ